MIVPIARIRIGSSEEEMFELFICLYCLLSVQGWLEVVLELLIALTRSKKMMRNFFRQNSSSTSQQSPSHDESHAIAEAIRLSTNQSGRMPLATAVVAAPVETSLINQPHQIVEESYPQSQWQCNACTFLNSDFSVTCDVCDTPRPIDSNRPIRDSSSSSSGSSREIVLPSATVQQPANNNVTISDVPSSGKGKGGKGKGAAGGVGGGKGGGGGKGNFQNFVDSYRSTNATCHFEGVLVVDGERYRVGPLNGPASLFHGPLDALVAHAMHNDGDVLIGGNKNNENSGQNRGGGNNGGGGGGGAAQAVSSSVGYNGAGAMNPPGSSGGDQAVHSLDGDDDEGGARGSLPVINEDGTITGAQRDHHVAQVCILLVGDFYVYYVDDFFPLFFSFFFSFNLSKSTIETYVQKNVIYASSLPPPPPPF
jgi:hypothetical protein